MRSFMHFLTLIIGSLLLIFLIITSATDPPGFAAGETAVENLGGLLDPAAYDLVWQRLPPTLELIVAALLLALGASRLIAAGLSESRGSKGPRVIPVLLAAAPAFWVGGLLIWALGVKLSWLPLFGRCGMGLNGCGPIWQRLPYLVMPSVALALPIVGRYAGWVDNREGSLASGFAFMGREMAGLVSNVIVVEVAFGWPGAGRLFLQSLVTFDFSFLVPLVFTLSVLAALGNVLFQVLSRPDAKPVARTSRFQSSRTIAAGKPTGARQPTRMGRMSTAQQTALQRLQRRPVQVVLSAPGQVAATRAALQALVGKPGQLKTRRTKPAPESHGVYWFAGGALGLLLLVFMLPLVNPNMAGADPYRSELAAMGLPIGSPEHPLGTDGLGRDYLARLLLAGRVVFGIAIPAGAITLIVGLMVGRVRRPGGGGLANGLVKFFNEIPLLPFLMLGVIFHGFERIVLLLLLGATGWMGAAKLSSRYLDRSGWRGLPWVRLSATALAAIVVLEANLSFVGIASFPPEQSYGALIGEGARFIMTSPHLFIVPGIFLTLIIWCLLLLAGDFSNSETDEKG